MLDLLTPRVWGDIQKAASNSKHPSHIAVAYFGERGDRLLPLHDGSSLVVDASIATVASGSTSPAALERMRKKGARIFTVEHLHAKVYAFRDVAFVGSANTSQRSERTLLEAVLRVRDRETVRAARGFVESLCFNELSGSDLAELATYYQPRATAPRAPLQTKFSTLLMELTNEQGGGRETQVQPPRPVWEHFFGMKFEDDELPLLTLLNESDGTSSVAARHVVKHHHNFTIELPGAGLPRPAILQMRRLGHRKFSYRVHRPKDRSFARIDGLVTNVYNPLRHSGRLWILI